MSELMSFILSQGDEFRRSASGSTPAVVGVRLDDDLLADYRIRQRLPSLYADFTLQRHSNPDGYAANTSAWISALEKATQARLVGADGGDRDTLSLRTGDSLLRSLETKEWGRPLALGTVIDEAVSQRRMMPYSKFLAARKSIYNRSWTVQPWWLLAWGLRQLGFLDSSINAGTLPVGRFVILQNVEKAASKIMRQIGAKNNQINRIHPMPLFRTEIAKILDMREGLTDSDLQIILTYLGRDKSAIIYDTQTVKFKDAGETSSTLSDQDRTISSLKSLIADINVQVAHLSTRIAALSKNAQTAIGNKNRASALAALRSRKLNETILSQRYDTLAQLEETYGKIEQAADQVTILRVMKDSTAVLRNLHAKFGGADEVGDVVESLRDEMSKVDEVSSALEAGGQGGTVIDESAVDEELEAMERQAKLEEEEREALETQSRLASIDGVEKAAKAIALKRQISTQGRGSLTEEDIKALKRLSLDEGAVAGVKKSGVSQITAEPVPDVIPGS